MVTEIAKIKSYFAKHPFSQSDLMALEMIEEGSGNNITISKKGLCNALVIEYARHMLKERSDSSPDFITKCNKKAKSSISDRNNFVERILLYNNIQPQIYLKGSLLYPRWMLRIANLFKFNNDFNSLDYLASELQYSSLLQLDMFRLNDPIGHSIAIWMDPKTHSITKKDKYKIFDPNFGEYETFSFQDFIEVLKDLSDFYQLDKFQVYDLERIVKDNKISQSKNHDIYNKQDKYILTNSYASEMRTMILHTACFKNDNILLKRILNTKGLELYNKSQNGFSPLGYTCINNNIEGVKMIIKHISPQSIDIYNYMNITSSSEIKNTLHIFNIKNKVLENLKFEKKHKSLEQEILDLTPQMKIKLTQELDPEIQKLSARDNIYDVKTISILEKELKIKHFEELSKQKTNSSHKDTKPSSNNIEFILKRYSKKHFFNKDQKKSQSI